MPTMTTIIIKDTMTLATSHQLVITYAHTHVYIHARSINGSDSSCRNSESKCHR